jgi:hypothetical protein
VPLLVAPRLPLLWQGPSYPSRNVQRSNAAYHLSHRQAKLLHSLSMEFPTDGTFGALFQIAYRQRPLSEWASVVLAHKFSMADEISSEVQDYSHSTSGAA